MITEKSNQLQVIMITDYDYPMSVMQWGQVYPAIFYINIM